VFDRRKAAGELRSASKRVRIVERLVYSSLGKRSIGDVRRDDVKRMLNGIAERNGPVMADHVLAIIRRVLNWYADENDDFASPIKRGMARTRPKDRVRKRTLSDDELRAVWCAAEAQGGPWGRLLQFLLLTATRRNEARQMSRAEVSGDTWVIPSARYKTKLDVVLPLSAAAQAVLATMPQIGSGDLIFTNDGRRPLGNFAKLKRKFDEACGVRGWVLHDLRRTARTLMSRARIDKEVKERCLGHVPEGIVDVYDQYEFYDEKKLAFEKLAALVEGIVHPQPNVVPMEKKRRT
jgi:integrase